MEEEPHTLVVYGFLGRIDNTLQHQVGLFELIPEKQISLRELHSDRIALCQIGTQHIKTAEHPATSRRFLICNRLFGSLYTEIGVEGTCILMISGQGLDAVGGDGIGNRAINGLLTALDVAQHLLRDGSCLSLCRHQNS